MTAQQDPAMKDVTEWINRSVGQHKRRISEGSASAARLIDKKVSECGFGVCARDPDCFDHLCHEHPGLDAMLGLPVIDIPFMDSQLMGDMPVEMIEPIPSVKLWAEYLKTAALVVVLGLVFGAVLLASVK